MRILAPGSRVLDPVSRIQARSVACRDKANNAAFKCRAGAGTGPGPGPRPALNAAFLAWLLSEAFLAWDPGFWISTAIQLNRK